MVMSTPVGVDSTGSLQTEARNGDSSLIDVVSTLEMCRIMNDSDATVAPAVKACLAEISQTIDLIADRVRMGGRVLYIGAGTSGRLGVLDASEIPPTFSAPHSQFIALMAGGDRAIRRAAEGAEDSVTLPVTDLEAISPSLNTLDTLIGIAASGRTPYVLAGLSHCQDVLKMLTVGIACVKPSAMRGRCECLIECLVGPEVVTGSTRLKAGTATKLILNMISTGVMVRIGKTYGNLMVDMQSSNYKLIDRARRIFRTVLPDTKLQDSEIDALIYSCGGSVKTALVAGGLGCSIEDAHLKLTAAGGVLRKAWEPTSTTQEVARIESPAPQLVLCIDAGGTKCAAVIANKDGILARAEAGPCNFVTVGHHIALVTISTAVLRAIALLPESLRPSGSLSSLPLTNSLFTAAWIGGAGLDRPADFTAIRPRIATLLSLSDPSTLLITNDAALLSSAIIDSSLHTTTQVKTGVVLISGTGSIVYGFRVTSTEKKLTTVPLERIGGWGYLLGDEGSAYFVGREALRRALRHRDMGYKPTRLHELIVKHFGCDSVGAVISSVYAPNRYEDAGLDPKLRIASVCRLVFGAAFPCEGSTEVPDGEARDIVRGAAGAAADNMVPLLRDGSGIRAGESTLVMGGALGQIEEYRNLVLEELKKRGVVFEKVETVDDAASSAALLLVKDYLA